MQWNKLGLIFNSAGHYPWMLTHAAYPTAEKLDGDLIRIYFSCRDKSSRSSIATLTIDLNSPQKIIELSSESVLSPGDRGFFDDSGTTVGSIVKAEDGSAYLYYLGWNIGKTVPFRNSIGLAIRPAGESTFKKYSHAPLLDRDPNDPLTLSYPWVLREGNRWRMWYGSHQTWTHSQYEMLHVLKYAESTDGLNWKRTQNPVMPLELEQGEFAMSRPCVIRHGGQYNMWFSSRHPNYKMGFATSVDGHLWQRDDTQGVITPSASGWDSNCVEYGSIFEHAGKLYMLYNGNGYGASGFGLAVASET
jgi:hypothetical protein